MFFFLEPSTSSASAPHVYDIEVPKRRPVTTAAKKTIVPVNLTTTSASSNKSKKRPIVVQKEKPTKRAKKVEHVIAVKERVGGELRPAIIQLEGEALQKFRKFFRKEFNGTISNVAHDVLERFYYALFERYRQLIFVVNRETHDLQRLPSAYFRGIDM